MLDDLVTLIETLQKRIRDHNPTLRENETRTRVALIDPLLTALGWEVSDPALVTLEYSVSGHRADYALLHPNGKPAATVEAKKLGEALVSHRMQMLNYSNASGVEYAGLTDGDHWELYEVFQRGQLEDRRILDISIATTQAYECALKLLLLWRPNLASGRPIKTEKPIVDRIPNPPYPQPGWVSLSSLVAKTRDASPKSIRFRDGNERQMRSWKQLVQYAVEWLSTQGILTEDKVPIASSNQRFIVHIRPIHPTGKPFKQQHFIAGTPFVIEGNISVTAAVNNTKKLLNHCGVSPDTVQLQVGE